MNNELIVDEYIRTMNGSAKNTTNQYRGYLNKFASYINKSLLDATVVDVMDFLESRKSKQGTPASNKTKNIYIFALRGFYAFLLRTKRIQFNPWEEVKEYKVLKSEKLEENKYLTTEEIKLLVRVLKKNVKSSLKANIRNEFLAKRDYLLYVLMLHRGFRINEMLTLEMDQIDFVNRTIHITSDKSKTSNGRTVGIKDGRLMEILNDYILVREKIGLGDKSNVFLSLNGYKLDNFVVNQNLKKYADLVGLDKEKAHCHTLRHTAATTHLMNHSLNDTAMMLGHKNCNTTMIYSHSTMEQVRENENNRVLDSIL